MGNCGRKRREILAINSYYDTLLENFDSKPTWKSHMAIFFVGMGLSQTTAEGMRIAHEVIRYAEKEIYADRPRLFSAPNNVDRSALPEWVAQTSFLLNDESHLNPRDGEGPVRKLRAKARQHTQFFRERLRMLSMLDLAIAQRGTGRQCRRFDALPRYSMSCAFVRMGEATLYAMIEGKRLSGRTCNGFSAEQTAKYSMKNAGIFRLPTADVGRCVNTPRTFTTDGWQLHIGWETKCTWIEREKRKRPEESDRPDRANDCEDDFDQRVLVGHEPTAGRPRIRKVKGSGEWNGRKDRGQEDVQHRKKQKTRREVGEEEEDKDVYFPSSHQGLFNNIGHVQRNLGPRPGDVPSVEFLTDWNTRIISINPGVQSPLSWVSFKCTRVPDESASPVLRFRRQPVNS